MLKLTEISAWDSSFFQDWAKLVKKIKTVEPGVSLETSSDFATYFGSASQFSQHNFWKAFAVYQDDQCVGSAAVSLPKSWNSETIREKFIPLGFFHTVDDPLVTQLLIEAAVNWAKEKGGLRLRGPMQGNFFGGYRWRLPSAGRSFQGEGIVPSYYFEHWKKAGFTETGAWTSYEVDIAAMRQNSEEVVRHYGDYFDSCQVTVRPVDFSKWDDELKIIYDALIESYRRMPEFMVVTLDEFRELYADFKYLGDPRLSYFLEYGLEKKFGGFLIAYRDPRAILEKAKASRWPGFLAKIRALWALKRNGAILLIPYVGKLDDCPIKGVIARLFCEVVRNLKPEDQTCVAAYIGNGSASYKSIPKTSPEWARYVLFEKQLV